MRKLLPAFLCVVAMACPAATALADFGDTRTIFVDRFDFPFTGNITSMTNEINGIMQDAADEGFTDVVWQVRARGDALYNSNVEPRAAFMTNGFDPLQTALDAAHSRGLKVHAWFNSTNMWNTNTINPPSGHIYQNTNPSFRLRDLNGNLEPQAGWGTLPYSSVNPILPEVHTHLNSVINDVATNYNVDGIHLDYIRYIPGTSNFDRLPHDSLSHQMFNSATGLDGSNPANAAAYENYIAGRITDLVASISQTVNTAETTTGRTMEYSASVWRDPDVGVNDYMQDYRTWLENDYFDIMMPMIYLSASNDATFFNDNLLNTMSIPTNTDVRPTLASYLHVAGGGGGAALTRSQVERAFLMGADGINFYDQPAYFNGYSSGDRASIKALIDSFGDPNASGLGNSLEDFEISEGAFGTSPSFSGSTDGILPTSTSDLVTTEAQSGNGSQQIVINADPSSSDWFVRHLAGGGSPSNNDAFTSEGFIGFWLKTDDPGITVQIALDDPGTADRGFLQPVQADGEWHLYQWNLEDDRQWEGWVSGNGSITGTTVTIDSIQFYGEGDATIYLDTISHNPDGFLAGLVATDPADFDGDGDIDSQDLAQWLGDYGVNGDSDANEDGNSDGADFLIWQQSFAPGGSSALASSAVPEPTAATLLLLAIMAPIAAVRKRR